MEGGISDAVGVVDVRVGGGSSGIVGRHVFGGFGDVVVGVRFRAVLLSFYTLGVSPRNSRGLSQGSMSLRPLRSLSI